MYLQVLSYQNVSNETEYFKQVYTHIKEKPSKYTFRDKSISGRYILKLHLITHTKENLINVCSLELCLIYEKTLNVNLRVHTWGNQVNLIT